jgi:hypothetical protein
MEKRINFGRVTLVLLSQKRFHRCAMHIDAATAGFLGTISGGIIGLAGNLITEFFDDRKERRQLMVKAAWDYWSKRF